MRRTLTREEFRKFIACGKKEGVVYSKKEKRFIKKITFERCAIFPEAMILIDPDPSPLDKNLPGNWGTAADLSDERILH
jgi:hypothetical protein|tara:strand:- start:2232 stop:2468 length:237 start_codon:yes stop_codon:yes gene_type:complete